MTRNNHLEPGEFGEGATVSEPRRDEVERILRSVFEEPAMTDTKAMPVGVRDAIADAIASADVGFSMNLVRLVDGVYTYTLKYSDGTEMEFCDDETDDFDAQDRLYAHVRNRKRQLQADAVLAALSTIEAGPGAVSDAQVEAALTSWFGGDIPFSYIGAFHEDMRAALKAAALSPIGGEAEPVAVAPHVRAAFINAIREEGTKAEACDYLQNTWNELAVARASSARFARLYGIVRRIKWIDAETPALENDQTKGALGDLAEFLFMDGIDSAADPQGGVK